MDELVEVIQELKEKVVCMKKRQEKMQTQINLIERIVSENLPQCASLRSYVEQSLRELKD